jgi:hypothetical protein
MGLSDMNLLPGAETRCMEHKIQGQTLDFEAVDMVVEMRLAQTEKDQSEDGGIYLEEVQSNHDLGRSLSTVACTAELEVRPMDLS